ncbi:MAG: MG2 domain-containing protein [Pseudomonadota bacterium]
MLATLSLGLALGCPPGPPEPATTDAAVATSQPVATQVSIDAGLVAQEATTEQAPAQAGVAEAGDAQKGFVQKADGYFAHNPSKRIYIQLDKPLYQPGETIWFRALAVNSTSLIDMASGQGLSAQLISPKGAVVLQKRVQLQRGYAASDFDLPEEVQGGEYILKVLTDDGTSDERPLIVNSYEPPRFKMKMDFVRKAYGPGDTASATIEVKRSTGEIFAGRDLTGVLTLDGNELPRVKVKTDDKGAALVRVVLPAAIERGDGILTVLVEDMGITESITKRVPIVLNKLKLSFFPEGGDLVQGLPSRVYFAAQNMIDKPADVEGKVVDDHGQTMATFTSYHDGQGRFDLTPATGRSYFAEITRPVGVIERFALPVASETGCTLRTFDDPRGAEPTIRCAVHCTEPRTVLVNAVMREKRMGTATAQVAPGKPAIVHLPLAASEMQGVARLTVFSETMEPLAERLVYRAWHKDLKITVKPDRGSYTPRGQVTLNVETTDLAGKPVAADLALSVVDDTVLSFADDKTAHMLTHLFLEKELPGKIEEPNFYFDQEKAKAVGALDMLLGTRGWRRFEWQKVLQWSPPPPRTSVATGAGGAIGDMMDRGAMLAADDDDARPLAAMAQRKGGMREGKQAARAARPDKRPRPMMAQQAAPPPPADMPMAAPAPAMKKPAPAGPAPAKDGLLAMAEPEVEARAPARVLAGKKAEKMDRAEDKRAMGRAMALNEIAAAPAAAEPQPVVAADGDWAGAGDQAKAQPAWEWAKVRVFPVPDYSAPWDGPRTDFRETVYWNPSVSTDVNGKGSVTFYLSDAVTSFRITAEGISNAGQAGRNETVLSSKLPFFMDVKLPLEVSAGDLISLPLTLKNETALPLGVALTTTFGEQIKLLENVVPGSVDLGASTGRTLLFPLEVVGRMGQTEVRIGAMAQGLKDEFTRQLKVVPLGFPRNLSQSGNLAKKASHSFDLKGAVEGSVAGVVSFYPSPAAQMLSGVASILQEPSGCFEQASSSNYPNIMVMRYLQEHDAAEPAIVERSSRLLTSGYGKIAGYESPQKGYEWFGGDPGHEALTAYGLMEFVDMKAVFGGVDSAMIERTKKWLYSRRDGKGGFQRNSRALDSFGGASTEVTDAYIVYALTEAGMSDLDLELTTVTNRAKTSSDPYIVALAANAQLNTRGSAAKTLVDRLEKLQQKDGRFAGTTHSVTRSGGQSLDVETTSLAILALAKDGKQPVALQRAMQWLLTQSSGYGGFGSTQATILALKAITAYDRAAKRMKAGGEIAIKVNGDTVQTLSFDAGRNEPIVFEDLGKHLTAGANTVELVLTSAAELPYTVSVDYRSNDPANSPEVPLKLTTTAAKSEVKMGETVRVTANLESTSDEGLPMTLIRIGIPGGLTFQTWQLKELVDKKLVDFYETRPREVIVYYRALPPRAKKEVAIDLVANVPGTYTAPASSTYLYYTAEHKAWASPLKVRVDS